MHMNRSISRVIHSGSGEQILESISPQNRVVEGRNTLLWSLRMMKMQTAVTSYFNTKLIIICAEFIREKE